MMEMNIDQIIQRVAILMPAFLIALVIHEFAHAWMAQKFGDRTSEWSGRLTLNPVAHMDPFGTVVFPLISIVTGAPVFFGWAKPVPINPSMFSSYRKGLFWVSFAGPLSNIFLGFIAAFVLVAFASFVPSSFGFFDGIKELLLSLISINFALAVFNLIPLPPLDGSNMVLSFLDHNASRKYLILQQYSFFILIFLMVSGAFRVLAYPILGLSQTAITLAVSVFHFAQLT
ncbi:MAG: site-2 protease family protein [Oligoflexia bacterium]|nr:site-2 protease family protein [Oligoflexia bacterium]